MKIKSSFMKYALFLGLSLGITNQSFSPNIKSYTGYTLEELTKIDIKRKKEKYNQFVINKLTEPVLKFIPPVNTGQVSCVYGSRKVNGKWEFHKGIDIGVIGNALPKFVKNPDILAVAPGIVSFAGWKKGYGKTVKIKHTDNLETIYGHLDNFSISRKDTVLTGQKIGEMGKSGNARSNKKWGTGRHLHFEARRNGKHFNPDVFFVGYEKVGIDDTLYSSTVYSDVNSSPIEDPVKHYTEPEKTNMKNVITSIDSSFYKDPKNIEKIKKYLSLFTLFDFSSTREDSSYSVQIAASVNPLSKKEIEKLEEIYNCEINCTIQKDTASVYKNGTEKLYYKYLVGNSKNLEEVLNLENSLESKVKKNLGILVYKDGKIVDTKW